MCYLEEHYWQVERDWVVGQGYLAAKIKVDCQNKHKSLPHLLKFGAPTFNNILIICHILRIKTSEMSSKRFTLLKFRLQLNAFIFLIQISNHAVIMCSTDYQVILITFSEHFH